MIKPTFLSIPGVLSVLFLASISIAQPYETNAQGDYAWFPDDPNILRLVDGTTRISKVCRWRSQKGNCYALTHTDTGGDMPVFLKTQAEFQSWLDAADRQANWDYCETIDNPWSAWAGTAPTSCGSHTYTQTSTCSVAGKADKPCPDTCPQPSKSRTVTVNNATCVAACVPNWTPPQSDYPSTVTFTQIDNSCGSEPRRVPGTGGPVDGVCGSVKNTCSAGTFATGFRGSGHSYRLRIFWNCQGLNGGTTQHCSVLNRPAVWHKTKTMNCINNRLHGGVPNPCLQFLGIASNSPPPESACSPLGAKRYHLDRYMSWFRYL